MADKKTTKAQKDQSLHYALSIHLKYGEVLHVEGIDEAERDKYLAVAKTHGETMLIESHDEVRILRNEDIAKVSTVAYNASYLSSWHIGKRIFLNESTIGRRVFTLLIKFFIFLCVMIGMMQLGLRVIDGTIMDVLFDPSKFMKLLNDVINQMGSVFAYIFVVMILLHLVDMLFGFRKTYYINQDGAPWVETSVLSNFYVTIGLVIGFTVAKVLMGSLLKFI